MASQPPAAPDGAAALGATTNWNGSWQQLAVLASTTMPQTPNGTTLFVSVNASTQNNDGLLYLTSGGNPPIQVEVPALTSQLGVLTQNWQANNLSVSNRSANAQTPISVALFGPGIPPGQQPPLLPNNGSWVTLSGGMRVQGTALPQFMVLTMQCTAATLCVFGVIGGKLDSSGNNGYVFSVNDSMNGNTGPGTGQPAPPGYYATTSGNTYRFNLNWGASAVFVANMSYGAVPAQVSLAPL